LKGPFPQKLYLIAAFAVSVSLTSCNFHSIPPRIQTIEPQKNAPPSSPSAFFASDLPEVTPTTSNKGYYSKESIITTVLPCYEIFELTYLVFNKYVDPFNDVTLKVLFTSPKGNQKIINGFYYQGNLWKVRFRPEEPGQWSFLSKMTDKWNLNKEEKGFFTCIKNDADGRVIHNPNNIYRWIYENGKPYFPIGLQDCINAKGGTLQGGSIDGEKRNDNSAKNISIDEYFSIYGQAGFNLFRFSQNNCSYQLIDDLNHYRSDTSIATDELLDTARKHGFRIMFGFFGFFENADSKDPDVVAKEELFIKYCVARWGVYADFWELLNETNVSDHWIGKMVDYLHSIDPDHKPISTSWEKPANSGIDIFSPHWYESESELVSDLRVAQLTYRWKQAGLPIIVGEQGNTGMNWDPQSGLRMRIRSWTALFQEISIIFWNTSWSKAGMNQGIYTPGAASNIYLGPEERDYIHLLHDFSSRLDTDMQITDVNISDPDHVRAYGLLSNNSAAAYLHHFETHTTPINDLKISLELPFNKNSKTEIRGEWINPSTGTVVRKISIPYGQNTLEVPGFIIDIALFVSSQ
jgi:hypothetical protein